MSPGERWQRVQTLCEKMESLAESDREVALAAAESDESVRDEVRRLLRALVDEERVRTELRLSEIDVPAEVLPVQIGAYVVTGLLGQGGTSSVYAAERQTDGGVQPVAVKVLHGYFTEQEQIERFRREQSILTRLDHPGICRVLDAGVTNEKQPYLVLDRVDGQPIDEYCDAKGLGLAERVRLVIEACDAIGAAHRSLVVHLDLKPGNMLVTATGHVRLLDFGTAKLLDPEGALTTTRHLTPLYASPEQLRGEAVTTACDIYGLGMILFEMLAGSGPYRTASIVGVAERASGSAATLRMAEKATAEAARRRGMALEQLRRELQGDIETIVAKALAQEPERRYASAGELADDLRRYLEDRPVLARKQTMAYRMRKYASRNTGAVTLTALLVVGLAAAIAFGWIQQQRALTEAKRGAAVAGFLQWLITSSNPNFGGRPDMTVLELVGRAEKKLERGDLADQGMAAVLESGLANALFQGGQPQRGEAVARRALERAVRAGDPVARVVAATGLGTLMLSRGDCAASKEAFSQADSVMAEARSEVPIPGQVAYLVSRDQVKANCENDPSGKMMTEAVALLPKMPDVNPEASVPPRLLKALTLNGYMRLLIRQGQWKQALTVSEEAMRLAAREPDGRNPRVALLQSRAAAEYAGGDKASAARSLEEAVELAAGSSAPFESIRLHVMAGQRLAEAGRKDRAVELADRALALADEHKGELAGTRWMVLIDAAITYMRADRCGKVPALVQEADTLTSGKMPPQWKGNRLATEALCLMQAGRKPEARQLAKDALAAAGSTWSPTSSFRKQLEAIQKDGK